MTDFQVLGIFAVLTSGCLALRFVISQARAALELSRRIDNRMAALVASLAA